jgi:hypothetical protein
LVETKRNSDRKWEIPEEHDTCKSPDDKTEASTLESSHRTERTTTKKNSRKDTVECRRQNPQAVTSAAQGTETCCVLIFFANSIPWTKLIRCNERAAQHSATFYQPSFGVLSKSGISSSTSGSSTAEGSSGIVAGLGAQ